MITELPFEVITEICSELLLICDRPCIALVHLFSTCRHFYNLKPYIFQQLGMGPIYAKVPRPLGLHDILHAAGIIRRLLYAAERVQEHNGELVSFRNPGKLGRQFLLDGLETIASLTDFFVYDESEEVQSKILNYMEFIREY